MTSIHPGDRLDVILDVYIEDDAYRVVLVGIYPPEDVKPLKPVAGVTRNVVQSWLNRTHHARVFQLPHNITLPDRPGETGTTVTGQS